MGRTDRDAEQALRQSLFVVPIQDRPRGLLAHHLDGRFGRLDTAELQALVDRLVPQVDLGGVDCVIGIPEGGSLVAFAFASKARLPLVLSTRMKIQLPNAVYFEEPHSVTADRDNYIYGLQPGDRVVIADDEITTGRTLVNAVRALRAAGVHVDQLVVLIASEDPATVARLDAEGVTVHAALRMSSQMTGAVVGTAAQP